MDTPPGDSTLTISPERTEALHHYLVPSTATFDECSTYYLWPEEDYLLRRYLRPGDRIADLACGMARTTLRLYEMGYSVIGYDLSATLIAAAQRRFPYLDLRCGSFTHVAEPDASFSLVLISANSIDLAVPLEARIAALHEAARVLRPGGTLIFSSHNLKSMHFFSPRYWRRPIWKLTQTHKAFRRIAHLAPHAAEDGLHGFWLAPEEVVAQTQAAGFTFLEMVGPNLSRNSLRMRYGSPYIHYAFRKK